MASKTTQMFRVERTFPEQCPKCGHSLTSSDDYKTVVQHKMQTAVCNACTNVSIIQLTEAWVVDSLKKAEALIASGKWRNLSQHYVHGSETTTQDHRIEYHGQFGIRRVVESPTTTTVQGSSDLEFFRSVLGDPHVIGV